MHFAVSSDVFIYGCIYYLFCKTVYPQKQSALLCHVFYFSTQSVSTIPEVFILFIMIFPFAFFVVLSILLNAL